MNNILITGGSSGIGAELAKQFSKSGVHLFLTGRNKKHLDEVARFCKEKGASVDTKIMDVTNRLEMEDWILKIDDKHPIDLVVANAGVSVGGRVQTGELAQEMINTNIMGVLNTIEPLIPRMQKRKAGHIAVVSSIVAYRAIPMRKIYSATKIAVRYFCDSWRLELAEDNIHVSCIHPGFVKTPLTDQNKHPMPGILPVEEAAKIIIHGLQKRKAIIAFPKPIFFMMRTIQCLPVMVADWLVKKFFPRNG